MDVSEREHEIAEIIPERVIASNILIDGEGAHDARYAIDRDLSTLAGITADNGAVWLKLKFDKTYFIHKVVIYTRFYTDWYHPEAYCVKSMQNYRFCANNDGNFEVAVYQGEVKRKSCGTLQLTYELEQSDQIYTLICNGDGDTVKLSKEEGVIGVYEVAVAATGNND